MTTIGFVVNPVAGMGGRVGLKGTDGMTAEAARRGARPVAPGRAREAMHSTGKTMDIVTCAGGMGSECLSQPHRVVYRPEEPTSGRHTREACRRFMEAGAECIVFCGGDGTARDVFSAVGRRLPLLGIPSGVKMHSSVFARTPSAAAAMLRHLLEGKTTVVDGDLMDIDEAAFREDRLRVTLFGHPRTLQEPVLMQQGKRSFDSADEEAHQRAIAAFLGPVAERGIVVLGGGTTTAAISRYLGVEKTLLGVDVLRNGRLAARDAGEGDILRHLDGAPARIVVSPMGGQGCILGRGNQQISPSVLRRVGAPNVVVAATPHKLLQTPTLFVDTGSWTLDQQFAGWRQVVVGYMLAARRRVMAV